MAGGAGRGLALPRRGVGVGGVKEDEEKQKGRPGGGLSGPHVSGQGEHHHAVAALEIDLRISARGNGDVLFALHRVGHRRRVDAGFRPGTVPQQGLPGRRGPAP